MGFIEQETSILKDSGFERCTFGPDEDTCEGCGISGLQLYYRRTCYENDEGEYKCLCCIAVREKEHEWEANCIEKDMIADRVVHCLAKLLKKCRPSVDQELKEQIDSAIDEGLRNYILSGAE